MPPGDRTLTPHGDNRAMPLTGHAPLSGRFEELRPAELAAILERAPLAFLPSGTLEWHCDHLPVGLDGLVAEELCLQAARRSGGVVVPPTYWAIGGVPYPFTTRITPEVVENLFASIVEQLGQVGFQSVLMLPCHYGIDHYTALKRVAVRAMAHSSMTVAALPEFELVTDLGFVGGDHAGAWETSLLLALRPDLVAMDRLPRDGPLAGVLGEDPRSGASPERGHALVGTLVERLAQLAARLAIPPSVAERSAHQRALAAQVEVLEQIRRDRATRPRALVRQLMTPPYLRYLDHFWRGEYDQAHQAADEARLALEEAP